MLCRSNKRPFALLFRLSPKLDLKVDADLLKLKV
jgi:hypothetical protein